MIVELIGDKLARCIQWHGYTQKEFAELVGVTEAAMSRYLNGSREPKLTIVVKMAEVLHTSVDSLVRDTESDSRFNDGFDAVYSLVIRNLENMSDSEKMLLIKALSG